MMIGTLERCRSARHTSVPDSPGSIRSSSTRSAPVRSNLASASGPVAATRPRSPPGAACTTSASENDSSSSTTSTPGHCGVEPHRRAGQRPADGVRQTVGTRAAAVNVDRSTRSTPTAAVVGRDVLDDGQPEPGAAGGARSGRVDPVEALEDPVQVRLGDADALIGSATDDRRRTRGRRASLGHPPTVRRPPDASSASRVARRRRALGGTRSRCRPGWPAAVTS